MKKTAIIFVLFLVSSFICMQLPIQGKITLWPGKLDVNIKSFSDQAIVFKKVQVKNPEDYAVIVRTELLHPTDTLIKEGHSRIPDLSWVTVSPQEMTIPANSEGFFNITIDIPKNNQSLHYNESWEVLAIFYQKKTTSAGGFKFNIKLASRVFIHTPPEPAKQQIPNNLYLILFLIMGLIILATVVFVGRKKKSIHNNGAAIYYVKEKKSRNQKNKKN